MWIYQHSLNETLTWSKLLWSVLTQGTFVDGLKHYITPAHSESKGLNQWGHLVLILRKVRRLEPGGCSMAANSIEFWCSARMTKACVTGVINFALVRDVRRSQSKIIAPKLQGKDLLQAVTRQGLPSVLVPVTVGPYMFMSASPVGG